MRNILLVLKNEILTTIGKRSFWIMTFIFPAFIILLNVGTQIMVRSAVDEVESFLPGETGDLTAQSIGYVDQAGILQDIPEGIPQDLLVSYPDESSAQAALESGEIESYYLIPSDYITSGEVLVISAAFRPFGQGTDSLIEYLIDYNLLEDPLAAAVAVNPVASLEQASIAPQGAQDVTNPLTFFVPFATMFIFFFLITMSSGFMLQSVSREKENRTVEVLLLSLRPRDLMLGKILGLSFVALLQMVIWFGGALLLLGRSQQILQTAASFSLPPGFAIWGLLYFIFGYLMYASLMGAIGAMAPSARESGSLTFLVLFPMMIPLWLNSTLMQSPHGALSTFLSLFPLTAPPSMMTRLSSGSVPLWQPLVGIALLAGTTYLVVLVAARFFRADTLLSGSPLDLKRLGAEFRQFKKRT
jgi:ABC-2 type transport system permease protein